MSQEPENEVVRPLSILAGFLSYVIPGLGQISQGRTGKGVLFMVSLLSLFHVGEAMGNWQNVYVPADDNPEGPRNMNPIRNIFNQRWHYAGQVWIGAAAWPAIWQYYGGPVPSGETSPFLHNYQRQPRDEAEVNQFLVNSDKTPDLGWIYTVIAGMLNILVIYDAYAGPAYGPRIPRGPGHSARTGGRSVMILTALFTLNMYFQLPILIVVISLVYSATRYDDWGSIFHEAIRWGGRMALFLAGIGAVLYMVATFI